MRCFACPAGTWEYACARPHPRLRRAVRAYRGFRVQVPGPVRRRGIPSGAVTLLLGFDRELRMWCTDTDQDPGAGGGPGAGGVAPPRPYVSMLGALTTGPRFMKHSGAMYGVEAVLAPWAAFAAFGVPMSDLQGAVVEPADLAGDRVHRLAETLAALPAWQQRFALLDTVLHQWLSHGPAWSPRVEWAYRELARTGGRVPVRRLAETVGWRPRQLEYRFREQIGLSPKAAARVFRLGRAVRLLAAGRLPAATAGACGFSDQAHLTREVRTMTGLTPSAVRAAGGSPAGAATASERELGHIRSVPLPR